MRDKMTEADTGSKGPASGLAEAYARWRASRLGQITDALERHLVLELLEPLAGETVLDVGCGDGDMAATLERLGAIVAGVDVDPIMIARARDKAIRASARAQFVEGAAESLPLPDEAFGRVVAVATLCFVEDVDRAVAEMARVLRPGGKLVIGDLGRSSLWAAKRRMSGWLGNPVWRRARFRTARDLRRSIEGAGLVVVETRGSIFYPPCGLAARLLAPIDRWLGRRTTLGGAFIALTATKPDGTQRVATSPK